MNRRGLAILLAAGMLLGFTGCSNGGQADVTDTPAAESSANSSEDETTENTADSAGESAEASGETIVVVQEPGGEIQIPINPKKIACLDISILDTIDALGAAEGREFAIPMAGSLPQHLSKFDEGTLNVGQAKEPNLELLYEFEPDVIFISARQLDYYDKLTEIAPTVYTPLDTDGSNFLEVFKDSVRMVGQVFQREEVAEEKLLEVDQKIAAAQEKAAKSDERALLLIVTAGNMRAFGAGSRYGFIFDTIGVKSADEDINVDTFGQDTNFEYILETNPDILFIIDRNTAIGEQDTKNDLLLNDLTEKTNAGQNGKYIYLNPAPWYLTAYGLNSFTGMIDEVAAAID